MSLSTYDDIAKVLVQPGRLVASPTNLATAFPHGGTSLGMTENGVLLSRQENYKIVNSEESGQVPVKIIHLGEVLYLQAELIEWDDAVLNQLWKGYVTAGGVSGNKNLTWPGDGTYYPGLDLSAQSIVLAFIPEDTSLNKVAVARKAIPVSPTADMLFKASEKSIMILRFILLEDTAVAVGNAKYNYRGLFVGDIQDVVI